MGTEQYITPLLWGGYIIKYKKQKMYFDEEMIQELKQDILNLNLFGYEIN